MYPAKLTRLKDMLNQLKDNESDPVIRVFSEVCLHEKAFFDLAKKIFSVRNYLNEEHYIYLVFVSLQYITHFSYDTVDSWDKIALKEKIKKDLILYSLNVQDLCLSCNVSTNVPERYAGLQIVSSIAYWKLKRPISVLDIGCSLGTGLMALNGAFFEERIEIDKALLEPIRSKPIFSEIRGLDLKKPDLEWVLASYLPEGREKRKMFEETYKILSNNGNKVEIIEGNALDIKKCLESKKNSFDIVWISNVCYQIEGEISRIIKELGWALRENGIWLYAYYRDDLEKKLDENTNPYVISAYIKDRNWDKRIDKSLMEFKKDGLEILEAPNELVERLKPGKDYKRFLDLLDQDRIFSECQV